MFDLKLPVRNAVIVIVDGDHVRRIPIGPITEHAKIIAIEEGRDIEPNYVLPARRTTSVLPVLLFALLIAALVHFTGLGWTLAAITILALLARR